MSVGRKERSVRKTQVEILGDAILPLRQWAPLTSELSPLSDRRSWFALVGCICLALGLLSLGTRSLIPVDETRYITVAWEMWSRDSFLVPVLNGVPYDHKPPLLFWLMHAGWAMFGVNEWWPRLLGPMFTLLGVLGLERLAAHLWPRQPQAGRLGTLMFLSTCYIAIFLTGLMFDMLLLACVAWGWYALVRAATRADAWRWWGFLGLAGGLAMLAKGPVALVYLLPPVLAWRWWAPTPLCSAWQPVLALVIALALPGLWLLAALSSGDADYFGKLLMEQTVQRVSGNLGHPRPVWWYLPVLPMLLLPWLCWPRLWRQILNGNPWMADSGARFTVCVAGVGFGVLSLVSGKQVHYLIPLVAITLLLLAHRMRPGDEEVAITRDDGLVPPAWSGSALRLAMFSLVLMASVLAGTFSIVRQRYDLEAAGDYAGAAQRTGRELAYVGNYQGEFGFYGRLTAPVTIVTPAAAESWCKAHPDGLVIARAKRLQLRGAISAEYTQGYKSDELMMFRAGAFQASGSSFMEPIKKLRLGGPLW